MPVKFVAVMVDVPSQLSTFPKVGAAGVGFTVSIIGIGALDTPLLTILAYIVLEMEL